MTAPDEDDVAETLLAADDWIRDPRRRTWVAARAVDVAAGLRDQRLSSRLPSLVGTGTDERRRDAKLIERQMVLLDGPEHARIKAAFKPAFTPSAVRTYRGRIEALIGEIIAKLSGGRIDLVSGVSRPAARESLAWLLAGDVETGSRLIAAGEILLSAEAGAVVTHEESARARRAVAAWASAREPGAVRELLLHDDLTADEIVGNVLLLIGAGTDTTANLISSALHRLLAHGETPGQAITAALTGDCPVQAVERVASEPLATPAGRRIAVGDSVLLHLGAATRELSREPTSGARHLAFGLGAHHCLGARVAMLVASSAVEAFARRYDTAEPEIAHARWHAGASFRGLAELVVDLPR